MLSLAGKRRKCNNCCASMDHYRAQQTKPKSNSRTIPKWTQHM